MAVIRDIEPWDALLAAGRDRRAPGDAELRPPPPRPARRPFPADLHPGRRRRDARQGLEAPLVPPGGGDRRRRGPARRSSPPAPPPASRWPSTFRARLLCRDPRARALYLYPTKALAQDQARALERSPHDARPAIYDGDTPREQRAAIRRKSNLLLTNPDMLHVGILPTIPRGPLPLEPRPRRGRRGARLPRRLRLARRQRAATPRRIAGVYGTAPRLADGERDDRQSGRARRAPVRPGGLPSSPRRLAGQQAHDRDVEPAADRRDARRAPLRARRGRRPAGRAGPARRAHDRAS